MEDVGTLVKPYIDENVILEALDMLIVIDWALSNENKGEIPKETLDTCIAGFTALIFNTPAFGCRHTDNDTYYKEGTIQILCRKSLFEGICQELINLEALGTDPLGMCIKSIQLRLCQVPDLSLLKNKVKIKIDLINTPRKQVLIEWVSRVWLEI